MGDSVKQILIKPIQLADAVITAAAAAATFQQECQDIKAKTEKLTGLLRQAARAGNLLFERPAHRIISNTVQVLDQALSLVLKCRSQGIVRRVLTIIPAAAFRKESSRLDNAIGDVSWLLHVSAAANLYLGLPPIAANDPILCLIWEQIAILTAGSPADKADAAASIASLVRDNDRLVRMVVEEGAVAPLLKLMKEGGLEEKVNAATVIGLISKNSDNIRDMTVAGACAVLANVLKNGPMKVQAEVAWAISEMAGNYPECQDVFARHNVIRLLISHLAFETVEEHSNYAIVTKATSMASNNTCIDDPKGNSSRYYKDERELHNEYTDISALGYRERARARARAAVDPITKTHMKAMAARTLWQLAKQNRAICRRITESIAMLCFAILLEKGSQEVKLNVAMALTEITAAAEYDTDLRRSAFKNNSSSYKAVIDQLLSIIIAGENSEILPPCIKAIGNLARTFRATETQRIIPIVKLLDREESEISMEACIALTNFVCYENYLHIEHSKTIIEAGGLGYLVQLVYFGEQMLKSSALILMCYVAANVPESNEIAETEVVAVVEWALKQVCLNGEEDLERVLEVAKEKLELYQTRGRGSSYGTPM